MTPFADRAVDRGLTGVLVALVRDLGDAYNANARASAFDRNDELADHIVRYLKRRAGNVSGDNAVDAEVERRWTPGWTSGAGNAASPVGGLSTTGRAAFR